MSPQLMSLLGALCAIGINLVVWSTWYIWMVRGDRAHQMIRDGKAFLLHVDPRGALDAEHVHGGRHIPVEELSPRAGELARGKTIVLCSHSFFRTLRAARLLRQMGWDVVPVGH